MCFVPEDAHDEEGTPPVVLCASYEHWPVSDPVEPMAKYLERTFKKSDGAHPLGSAPSDASLRDRSIAALRRRNIVTGTSGNPSRVQDWWSHVPNRIIRAVEFGVSYSPSMEELRALHQQSRLHVLGEVSTQYGGTGPDNPKLEPSYALAEELDIPVAIHMGLDPTRNLIPRYTRLPDGVIRPASTGRRAG